MRTQEEIRQELSYYTKAPVSENGMRVATLLEQWLGLHHIGQDAMRKLDWSNPRFQVLELDYTNLDTYDGEGMTALVFLAHDHCIRVGVTSRGRKLLAMFHPRQREGSYCQRHPTLETAVARWRERNQPVELKAAPATPAVEEVRF